MLVLGVSGSLRRDSYNRTLLAAAASELGPGVELVPYEGLVAVPPYDEDLDAHPAPETVADLRAAIAGADAVLIATPEYNASVPGQLKNAIDWASRPFPDNALRHKPIAVIGASTSLFGGVWAQADLRKILNTAGARVLDDELAVASAQKAFRDDGSLEDLALRAGLAVVVERLVRAACASFATAA